MIAMNKHADAVRADLIRQPGVLNVTFSSGDIIDYGGQTGDNSWDGKEKGETIMLSPIGIHKDFISFFKMKMQQGSAFTGSVTDFHSFYFE